MKSEMFEALKKVQAEIKPVKRDATNSFFSRPEIGKIATYATLGAVWESVQPILAKHGFVIIQPVEGKNLHTILIHLSGETIESNFPIVSKSDNNPQDFGSAVTYARRYSISSLLGIVTEDDDDGNKANNLNPENKKTKEISLHDKLYKLLTEEEREGLMAQFHFETMEGYYSKMPEADVKKMIKQKEEEEK